MKLQDERLFKVIELAKRWRVGVLTVRRQIASGRLEALHIGRGLRIRASEVERYEKAADARPAA